MNRQIGRPVIPTNILLHLGAPDEAASNITISFIDYIKNVACSEIYPTWPENCLRANILVQISFALNRIYNEWYPSQGYDFDMTSHAGYDQAYIQNRTLYENITKIVDEIFNNYIIKGDQIQPLFTPYCDGKKTQCKGLSQWQSVTLAKEGKTPIEILRYFYGKDVSIIEDAQVANNIATYPGVELKLGDMSEHIRIIKRQLNRIHNNYPAIPVFEKVHEFFDIKTEQTIKIFQDLFDLNITGIIDKSTWYKIKYLYTSVKKLADIYSEGISYEEVELKYDLEQKEGIIGVQVQAIHYFLKVIAYFNPNIPLLEVDSVYDKNTKQMVMAFQNEYGLDATGIVDTKTWNKIKEVYLMILSDLPKEVLEYKDYIYPGRFLSLGMMGTDITSLQRMLNTLAQKEKKNQEIAVTGCYDTNTEMAIKKIQEQLGLEQNGVTGPLEWRYIVNKIREI